MILYLLWDGNGNYVDDNTLSVYIRRLRSKIEDTPNVPAFLLTERGFGYKQLLDETIIGISGFNKDAVNYFIVT